MHVGDGLMDFLDAPRPQHVRHDLSVDPEQVRRKRIQQQKQRPFDRRNGPAEEEIRRLF